MDGQRVAESRVLGDVRNLAVSRMYLLKTMVLELSEIQVLRDCQVLLWLIGRARRTQCIRLGERRQAQAQTCAHLGSP